MAVGTSSRMWRISCCCEMGDLVTRKAIEKGEVVLVEAGGDRVGPGGDVAVGVDVGGEGGEEGALVWRLE